MERLIRNIRPLLLLVLLNALGMLLLLVKGTDSAEDMALLCGIMCVVSIVAYVVITLCHLGDTYLFIIISMLSSVGVIMQSRINGQAKTFILFGICRIKCNRIHPVFYLAIGL